MKNVLVAALAFISTQEIANASAYLGKIGPFAENESRTATLKLPACDASVESLNLYVEKSSLHHIPRIHFNTLTLVYEFQTESVSGEEFGTTRGLSVSLDSKKGCLKELILTAEAKGMNPGRPNMPYIEVWTN